jgi:hypothetical protein
MRIELPQTSNTSVRFLEADKEDDHQVWDSLVDSSISPDVYYRAGYVQAYEAAGHGRAAALVVDVGGGRAFIPVLLRSLSELSFATDASAFDAITAYGYGGLLLLDGLKELSVSQARMLVDNLRSWSTESHLVSLLVRLHPLLRQTEWINGGVDDACSLHDFGPTIALQTCQWNESVNCVSTLGKGRRTDLSVARRNLEVTWMSQRANREEDLHTLFNLYQDRMDQIDAAVFYHFPPTYYSVLAERLKDRFDIAIAWLGGEAVGGAVFMADRRFAHYHLSATNELGRTNKAMTLLINEAVLWARRRGCEYLHLGGGSRGKESLFAFKKSFGGEVFRYSFMTLILDSERYSALLEQRLADSQLPPVHADFFPQYRA